MEEYEVIINYEKEVTNFLSTRSKFYNIEPIGIGSADVESLSSYISRLAIEQNVSLTDLLKVCVSPFLSKEYLKDELSKGITKSSMYINENSVITLDYVNALESLTGRSDLLNLTMLNWSGIITGNIRSKHRKWCPICLFVMQSTTQVIYEPLMWYLSDITTCYRHLTPLKQQCPECNRHLPFLHSRLKVGYCQYCEVFLGEDIDFEKVEFSKYDELFYQNFKELIERNFHSNFFPTKISVSLTLKRIIENFGFKSNSSFANFVEYKPFRVINWIKKNKVPSHRILFDIAQKFNCSIYGVIYDENINYNLEITERRYREVPINDIENHLKIDINSIAPISLNDLAMKLGFDIKIAKKYFPHLCKEYEEKYFFYRKKLKTQKKNDIEKILNECLSRDVPISATQFAKEHGLTFKVLKIYAPELCKKVSERYKTYISEKKKKRINEILDEIRRIAVDMHERDIYPSKERVENHLGRVVFLEKEVRDGWRDIVSEMGYIPRESSLMFTDNKVI